MKQAIHKYQTSDYMEWDVMLSLIRKLYRDGNYRMSLLIGCGCFFGLRISDILTLTWSMLLDDDKFTLNEKKTNKRRTVKINSDFQQHIKRCHDALRIKNDDEKCFLSQKKVVYSTQRINVLFKDIKKRYNLKIEHFSTHSMRKTFGRKVYESSGENANMALIKLSEIFNHSNISITKIYLGIREKELLETYDLLDF
ncbi:tyrosine-type recombinase/integrase [Phocaeicola barnesiae]|uniref:tyrosine-type recombinase/integrase n=1 Tax=Phocaeicola barnesiae TaxID=376804 RepID=UPI0025A3DBBF|nr:tyrosine-type recombinase/integrase [Phocaeicola barnesiae]MDM8252259.1 tyrosine-type recombinase/integrase [Phocaeicola barnesiae]